MSFRMSARASGAALAAAMLAVPFTATAQAAGPVLPPSGGVLYVTNAGSSDVSALAIGPRATLTPLGKPLPTGGTTPRGIALTPDGNTAYVVNSDSDQLSVFRIGARGALQPNPQIFQTGDEPWGATVSPNGRTLYVTNTADATISAYRIGPDGTPAKLGDFTTTSDHPKQTVLSPDGRFLYLAYADADETADSPTRVVTRFAVRPDGTLGPGQDVAKVGPADFGIAISPDGGLLYVDSVVARNVSGFRRNADGSLTPVPGSPFSVPDPDAVKITPDGRHLYVAASDDISSPPGGVAGFTIRADGSLTPTIDSPLHTHDTAEVAALAITPDGRDVFAAIRDTGQVVAAEIGPAGTLKAAPGSPFPTGGQSPRNQSLAIRPAPASTTP